MTTSDLTTSSAERIGALPAQREPGITEQGLVELAGALRGALLLPGTPEYARRTAPFNLAVRVEPAAVVAARDAYDVATAVRLAGAHGLRVVVQATGHGARACAGDTLLISTGDLDECTVHPAERWARVGAGVRWRTLLDAAGAHGLTGLAGSSSGVGVAGYVTSGGVGPLARTFGVASDRVRALDVVTGQGRLVRATATEHPDLFWALRGGRGSLGVVTALELDLVPLRTAYGGALHFDGAHAGEVLHAWRRWAAALPLAATTSIAVMQLPDLPGVPAPLAGRLTVAVRLVLAGGPLEGEQLLRPLRAVAAPLLDRMGELRAGALDGVHADPVEPRPSLLRSELLRELPPQAVDALLAVAGPGSGSPLAVVELRQLGGAVAAPPAVSSAFSHRDAAFVITCIGPGAPGIVDAVAERAGQVLGALAPWSTGSTLPGLGGGAAAYDVVALERLRALLAVHDPAGVLVAADDLR